MRKVHMTCPMCKSQRVYAKGWSSCYICYNPEGQPIIRKGSLNRPKIDCAKCGWIGYLAIEGEDYTLGE